MRIKIANRSEEIYRGINRQFKFSGGASRKDFDKYQNILDIFGDQNSIPLTDVNLSIIDKILKEHSSPNSIEVILFGEVDEKCEFGKFLGYDISGISLCFSPLSDVLCSKSSTNPVSNLLSKYFIPKTNENGLFWSLEDAIELSMISTYLNELVEGGFFEPDESIRPLAVYMIGF